MNQETPRRGSSNVYIERKLLTKYFNFYYFGNNYLLIGGIFILNVPAGVNILFYFYNSE